MYTKYILLTEICTGNFYMLGPFNINLKTTLCMHKQAISFSNFLWTYSISVSYSVWKRITISISDCIIVQTRILNFVTCISSHKINKHNMQFSAASNYMLVATTYKSCLPWHQCFLFCSYYTFSFHLICSLLDVKHNI